MTSIEPLGDRAWIAQFATEREAAAWSAAVRSRGWPGVLDVVPAYQSAAVFADPDQVDLDELRERLEAVRPEADASASRRRIELPVLYEGEDLAEVSRRLAISEAEVVSLHTGLDYEVFAIGFLPGFPYAGYLAEPLGVLPRRESPRLRVPAGSVAIAGRQTGVYPGESPGGWHLLGRTPLKIVDLEGGRFPIRAGDRLRFVPIDSTVFEARRGELLQ
jgi:KipI family sensor histidine kinase inhibitor